MIDVFFNRTDAYARYNPARKQWECVKEPMTEEVAKLHLSGEIVIGAYSTDPATQACKWCCWDLDCHGSGMGTKEELLLVVLKLEIGLRQKSGVYSVIEDSGGGYHVWQFFDAPVPAADLIDWKGPIDGLEFFPKQRRILPNAYGNLVRIPGRHHKKTDHWSRVLIDGQWVEWPDAAEVFFDPPINEASLIPAAPLAGPTPTASPQDAPSYVRTGADAETVPEDPEEAKRFSAALRALQPRNDDRELWLKVGMILHHERGDEGFMEWMNWSGTSSKFDPSDQVKTWQGFGAVTDKPVTRATLFHLARSDGHDTGTTYGTDACEVINSLWNVKIAGMRAHGSEVSMTRFEAMFDVGGGIVGVALGGGASALSMQAWIGAYLEKTLYVLEVSGNGAKEKAATWRRIIGLVFNPDFIERVEGSDETIRSMLMENIGQYLELEGRDKKSYLAIKEKAPVREGAHAYINKQHFNGWMKVNSVKLPEGVRSTLQWLGYAGAGRETLTATEDDGAQAAARYWRIPADDLDDEQIDPSRGRGGEGGPSAV